MNIANLKANTLLSIVKNFEKILSIKALFKVKKSENKNVNIKKINPNRLENEKYYIKKNNKYYLNKILSKYYE